MLKVFAESKTMTVKGSTGHSVKVGKKMKVSGSMKGARLDNRTRLARTVRNNGQRVTRGRVVGK